MVCRSRYVPKSPFPVGDVDMKSWLWQTSSLVLLMPQMEMPSPRGGHFSCEYSQLTTNQEDAGDNRSIDPKRRKRKAIECGRRRFTQWLDSAERALIA